MEVETWILVCWAIVVVVTLFVLIRLINTLMRYEFVRDIASIILATLLAVCILKPIGRVIENNIVIGQGSIGTAVVQEPVALGGISVFDQDGTRIEIDSTDIVIQKGGCDLVLSATSGSWSRYDADLWIYDATEERK